MEITFGQQDDRALLRPHNDALVVTIDVAGAWVARTFVDTGSSVNIMYYDCWTQLEIESNLQPPTGSLFRFSREMVVPVGTIRLPITLGSPAVGERNMIDFVVLDLPSTTYNIILRRHALNAFQAMVSTYHLKMKFPVEEDVGEMYGSQRSSNECYVRVISMENKVGLS